VVEGYSKTAWCADYWRGKCLGRGWWWTEFKEAKKPRCWPKHTKNGTKNGRIPALIDLKIAENDVFHSKVLYKTYSQDIF
jgi:hypothetical protein